jgi:carotenoid cleavage dioxygenase-like enzyme
MSPRLLRTLLQQRRDIEADASAYLSPVTEARKEPSVFVELDTRQNDGYTVSLLWDRDTGRTQIVVGDIRDASELVFAVPAANAGDAFRHPFTYAP